MRNLKLFEKFKTNNITRSDVEDCIKTGGSIYTQIVKDFPENNSTNPLKPVDIDDDNEVTVEIDGKLYYVDLDDISKFVSDKIEENNKISIVDTNLRDLMPKNLSIITSNGEFVLELSDCVMQFPKLCLSYWHSTPEKTGDVLVDGEPDYLSFDLNFVKVDDHFEINVENTYGDAMMFEYKILPPNTVKVGHYNGINSKFDPNYLFSYTEESIQDLMDFFNKFTFGLKLTRDRFNFLDTDKDSYKIEKVGIVTNFKDFIRRG